MAAQSKKSRSRRDCRTTRSGASSSPFFQRPACNGRRSLSAYWVKRSICPDDDSNVFAAQLMIKFLTQMGEDCRVTTDAWSLDANVGLMNIAAIANT